MRYVTVRVTQEDIAKGEAARGTPEWTCPVRVAVRRQGYPAALVGGGGWWPHGTEVARTMSDRAYLFFGRRSQVTSFIRRFDIGKPVRPATFRLPLP